MCIGTIEPRLPEIGRGLPQRPKLVDAVKARQLRIVRDSRGVPVAVACADAATAPRILSVPHKESQRAGWPRQCACSVVVLRKVADRSIRGEHRLVDKLRHVELPGQFSLIPAASVAREVIERDYQSHIAIVKCSTNAIANDSMLRENGFCEDAKTCVEQC